VLDETVAAHANRVALKTPAAVLTYRDLSAAAGRLAARLRTHLVGPGDRVGVRVPSGTTDLYVAILGVLTAGASYVPVDADDPDARAEAVWADAGVCAVVGADLEIDVRHPGRGATRPVAVGDEAWVIFTSGSTGRPKGVAVSHRSAAAFVDAETALWIVEPEDRVLAGLSVGFDASCEEMWLAWRNGAALHPAPRALVRAGAELGTWLADQRISVISTVPTLAAMWDERQLGSVRLLILGGEACPTELGWRLAAEREVWNTYGPTEATVVSTASPVIPGEAVSIGWPLDGWRVAVVDADGDRVPHGEPGELVIGGVGLGHYLDPELDAERFAPLSSLDWPRAYRTGDVVCQTTQGLAFIGRRDDQIKLGGRRLELGEIDAQLASAPGVLAAAATLRRTASGNTVLVGYVTGDVDPTEVREYVAGRLPDGIVPLVVALDQLPIRSSGKVDRDALPWPAPSVIDPAATGLTGTAAWLAERWAEQLGPLKLDRESDFFQLGGNSLAAAKLASVLRCRYPSFAIAELYGLRRLGPVADRLDELVGGGVHTPATLPPGRHRWEAVQFVGVALEMMIAASSWLIGILAFNNLTGGPLLPRIGWGWLIAGWFLTSSVPGRALIVVTTRRFLIGSIEPGRYPRYGWLACRLWFVERITESFRLGNIAGTPWAARYARLCGVEVGEKARLGTLPPATGMMRIGADATIEADVDVNGWWIEGSDLVIGEVYVGPGARVGTRALLMPGAHVGAGAEVEPGSVVDGEIPPGERWAGSPARMVGRAGEHWPSEPAPPPTNQRRWRAMFGVGLAVQSFVPIVAAGPALLLLYVLGALHSARSSASTMVTLAPIFTISFFVGYMLVVAVLFRAVAPLIRTGWQPDEGSTGWAMWFSESLLAGARGVLFPLYSSVYTRPWLRLLGIQVGRRAEVSTAVGLHRHVSFAATSFAADDVVFASARARGGWLEVAPITVGSGAFLGNGALIAPGTRLGEGSLVGVLTVAPHEIPVGTSWLGAPALELPRIPDPTDPARTVDPPRRLILARGTMELVRLLLPGTVSVVIGALIFAAVESVGRSDGLWPMFAAAPALFLIGGIAATLVTIAAKWLIMGRYRSGNHPLWSFFVWRDELINSCQEQLAGAWLLGAVMGTPLMGVYLRAMGTRVGRGVWCETLTITEFDLVDLGDGCVVNRRSCVETHLFHDRLMRIGPIALGAGSTLGPSSVVLPDARLGDGTTVGGRSVVLRGEELPDGTRWHGAPVVST